MGWPGLATEVGEICRELDIENVNTTKYNKYDYKTILSEACHRTNEAILRQMAEGKEKCSRIVNEVYIQKKYIEEKSIAEVRNTYRSYQICILKG